MIFKSHILNGPARPRSPQSRILSQVCLRHLIRKAHMNLFQAAVEPEPANRHGNGGNTSRMNITAGQEGKFVYTIASQSNESAKVKTANLGMRPIC